MEYVLLGFYRKALQLSGAKQVSVRFNRSAAEGVWELDLSWN